MTKYAGFVFSGIVYPTGERQAAQARPWLYTTNLKDEPATIIAATSPRAWRARPNRLRPLKRS